jgi:hypothetical protein
MLTSGPGGNNVATRRSNEFESIQRSNLNLNKFQIHLNFDRSKQDLPKLKKIEIKYDFEGFEERNNLRHRNFFKSEVEF